jgi:hypothetical protein
MPLLGKYGTGGPVGNVSLYHGSLTFRAFVFTHDYTPFSVSYAQRKAHRRSLSASGAPPCSRTVILAYLFSVRVIKTLRVGSIQPLFQRWGKARVLS